MKKIFFMIFVLSIFLSACNVMPTPVNAVSDGTATEAATEAPVTKTSEALTEIPLGAGYGVHGLWFDLYFTNPQSPLASQKTGGPDGPLVKAIDSARLSVDVAAYSLSLNSVRDALLRAHDRGARVRMVMESDNLDRSDPQRLKDADIPILGDRREGLMHDKFIVIDNSEIWLGSMNFTDSGAYEDNNNLMRIRSVKMAENYTREFEEMFLDDKFGPDVVAETPNPRVDIDGAQIDVYFSPDDGVQANLLSLLETAESSVHFMAFSFTSDELGGALNTLAKNGVRVSGVMEEEQVKSNVGTEFDPFKQAKLDVRIDGNEGLMHHKVMIIDGRIVVIGSYNFTNSAETRNDENLLVIYNKDIAAQFTDEFYRVYKQAKK